MSKIVEYMNEIGLTNFDNIQDYFFKSNLETIISLHEYLQELAYEDWSISDYSPYSFAPSMELCGFGGCEEYHCKLQRASVFNKFASLYGDTVYFIVNSITNPHIPDFSDDKHKEFEYRYHLMSDCSLIFLYSELIVRNIAKIIPPHFSICPDCFAKCICNEDALLSLNPISQKYSEKAVLEVIEYNSKTKNGCIVIKNLPELFPNHDAYVNVYGEYETSRPLYAIFICLKIIIHCSENDRRTNAFLEIEFIEHSFISSVIHADFCSEFLHHPIFTLRHNVRFLIDGGEIYRKLFFVYNLLFREFQSKPFRIITTQLNLFLQILFA